MNQTRFETFLSIYNSKEKKFKLVRNHPFSIYWKLLTYKNDLIAKSYSPKFLGPTYIETAEGKWTKKIPKAHNNSGRFLDGLDINLMILYH
jgi:hypothetical protein